MTKTDDPTKAAGNTVANPDDAWGGLIEYAKTLAPEDDDVIQSRIMAAMLNAGNANDLLNAGSAAQADDLLNVPLRIEGIRGSESDYSAGSEWYLHVDAVRLDNNQAVTFSTGARDVLTKLLLASKNGWLPMTAKLVKAERKTKNGYFPTFLRGVPDDELPFT